MVKNLPADAGGLGSTPGLGGTPGKGNGNPLQYSCLGNPMDRRGWRPTVQGVARVGHDLATKPPPTGRSWPVLLVSLWPSQGTDAKESHGNILSNKEI